MNVIRETDRKTSKPDCWDSFDASLFERLAAQHGTPFFLYETGAIRQRIARVRNAFQGLVKVYYAVKTNPNLELIRALAGHADGLDISSGGELEQSLLAGFDPAAISFAGPAKTAKELERSLEVGLGAISVESERELSEIMKIAESRRIPANVVLRLNPRQAVREFGMKMGGRPTQFGIDEEDVERIAGRIEKGSALINFRGIHLYVGSQCFDPAGIASHVSYTLELARRIAERTSLRVRTVNLGGGFGVSHTDADAELDVEAVGEAVTPQIREFLDSGGGECEVVFELGRYLALDSGIYVTRVISRKVSRGKTFFMVDGGLNHHLAAAGVFGAGLRSNYLLRNLTNPAAPVEHCHVAGPSCNPTDLLGVNTSLARPELGHLIGVLKSGSYALTASPVLFLGRATPAEIVHRDGELVLGRRSHSILEFN